MFADWGPEKFSDHNILFYEEWTDEAAELMIKMDAELFRLLRVLPVTEGYLTPLIDYYESHDAPSLRRKIASITGFKGILSPMKQEPGGWVPDYSSRYFTEDFGYSLRYIYELLQTHNIDAPCIEKVYRWGLGKIS